MYENRVCFQASKKYHEVNDFKVDIKINEEQQEILKVLDKVS